MVAEHELVVLTRAVEAHGLRRGDIGGVVYCYDDRQARREELMAERRYSGPCCCDARRIEYQLVAP